MAGDRLDPAAIPHPSKDFLTKLLRRQLMTISCGFEPTKNQAAIDACRAIAHTIARDMPPTWFVNYLQHSVVRLAVQRQADEGRRKLPLKKLLKDFAKSVAGLEHGLKNPQLAALLGERKHQLENAEISRGIKCGSLDLDLEADWRRVRGQSSIEDQRELQQLLGTIRSDIKFALQIPELSGAGRRRAYFRGNVPPKQLCAIIIMTACEYFKGKVPTQNSKYECAEQLWNASTDALGDGIKIKDLILISRNNLKRWHTYFKIEKNRENLFPIWEDCRLAIGSVAYTTGALAEHELK